MATAIANLKSSDPTLADKLQRISDRRAELEKSGTSDEDTRKTIESEFGGPTEAEMSKIAAAGGPPRPGGPGGPRGSGGPKGPPPAKSSSDTSDTATSVKPTDLQAFLDAMGSNSAVAQLLSARMSASAAS